MIPIVLKAERPTVDICAELCQRRGWPLVDVRDPFSDEGMVLIFETHLESTNLQYHEELGPPWPHLRVVGPAESQLAADVLAEVTSYNYDDIVNVWRGAGSDEDDRMHAMYLAGVGAPEQCHPVLAELFREGLSSPEPRVRLATLHALRYRNWVEMMPDIEKLLEDPYPQLQREADASMDYLLEKS